MKKLTSTIVQAMVLLVIAFIIGFAFNSFSRSGINPLKMPVRVPVVSDSLSAGAEGIKTIDIGEAKKFFGTGVIIDARRKEDYDEGHIPGAVLIDYYEMGNYLDQALPILTRNHEMMIYCSGPSCEDSELLAKHLYALGFKKLLVFKGGFERWSEAGLPVEKGGQ
jgi:rhodanese-related sulfurtransferase